jgi:prepilin-type N-terminal cleavage/methylation domain-containing protein
MRRGGFTLTELLVALAIMVILFALLFAPMMAGLDWVSTGRANVGLQDACRYAMEQVRRELGEAVYVFPTPGAVFTDERVPNFSQVVFIPPARDDFGRIGNPPSAEYVGGQRVGVRYNVHLVWRWQCQTCGWLGADAVAPAACPECGGTSFAAAEYSEDNPFALFREEFLIRSDTTFPDGYDLGSYDSVGTWVSGLPTGENALTPKRGATFVPTTSVCLDPSCRQQVPGYATVCPSCSGTSLMYEFSGVQFTPQRIAGEVLSTDNGVLYQSRYGAWDGPTLNGAFLPDGIGVAMSQIDPHIQLYAWNGAGAWSIERTDMDSRSATVRSAQLRWDRDRGEVRVGTNPGGYVAGQWAEAPYREVPYSALPSGSGWYTVPASGSLPAEITPVWPSTSAAPADEADAPIGYHVDPAQDATGLPAVIEPWSVRVRAVGVTAGGQTIQMDLKPTSNFQQTQIKGDEFCAHLVRAWDDTNGDGLQSPGEAAVGTKLELRFSRYDPPRPTSVALFGGTSPGFASFRLQISYYYRRNFVYDGARDAAGQDPFVSDQVKVDYSTRTIQNVALSLQRYVDLEEFGTSVFRVPPDEHPNEVSVREQLTLRNFGR